MTERSGTGLARSESSVETPLATTVVDLAGSIITFEVPPDLDVWVTCRVPYLGCNRRGALAVVYLTDEQDRVVDSAALKAAQRHDVAFLTVDELVPAGSGTVTRKLRGATTKGRGVANRGGSGTITMDAFLR